MDKVRRTVLRLADSDAPVLIRGETGTGKELVARALHHTGPRKDNPFVAVNCSALPGTLIESLLFGHEKGAFTGAERRMRGKLEIAADGTVLLDEIAEMPGELQAKLLRVLEDRCFEPLGAEKALPLNARVIAATHVDLEKRMNDGTFRRDLFYRLNVLTIPVPPLSEHMEDIPELVDHFLAGLTPKVRVSEDGIGWLTHRRWPGNVRELRNALERVSLLSDSEVVSAAELESVVGGEGTELAAEVDRIAKALLALPDRTGSKLQAVERAVLHHAIEVCGGNKSAAARLIGLDRRVLDRKWDRLSEPPDSDKEGGTE